MPKIVIGVPTTNKKFRHAETSIQKLKQYMRARFEKYGEATWRVYTMNPERMTLQTVCDLLNATSKRLAKTAVEVQSFAISDSGKVREQR